MNFSDIVEENGKTIKENNLAIEHKYPIGSMVELVVDDPLHFSFDPKEQFSQFQGRFHLYVISHERDCDGTPLYNLGTDKPKVGENSLKAVLKHLNSKLTYSDLEEIVNKHKEHYKSFETFFNQGLLFRNYSEESLHLLALPK